MKVKDMFKFTAKDKYHGVMQYSYFENGYAFATTGRVCLKAKLDYPKEYEKSIITKKLDKYDKNVFPNCNRVFRDSSKNDYTELNYDINYFKRAVELYDKVQSNIESDYFEVQLKIANDRSYYLHIDIVEYILKYLAFYPNAKLYIPNNRLSYALQFEVYKNTGEDSIFDIGDSNTELDSAFVFMSDKFTRSNQIVYTAEDKIYVENTSEYNRCFKDIPRSNLEDTGYTDMEMMEKYFKKYDLPSAFSFKDKILSSLYDRDVLNIGRFCDYIRERYGKSDKDLDERFKELFGEDARLMASFFGVDRDIH